MICIQMIFGKSSGNLNIKTLNIYGKPQFTYSVVVYKYLKHVNNLENHSFSSALTETDSSFFWWHRWIYGLHDRNSDERNTKSDLRNAAHTINITAVVRGSLSISERKKKLGYWSTASSEVQEHAELQTEEELKFSSCKIVTLLNFASFSFWGIHEQQVNTKCSFLYFCWKQNINKHHLLFRGPLIKACLYSYVHAQ